MRLVRLSQTTVMLITMLMLLSLCPLTLTMISLDDLVDRVLKVFL